MLLVGRALIGLGVAAALTAGLKALVLWFPGDRLSLLNGLMVMLGALGAVTATLPADLLLVWIGWRELFGLFALLTAACAAIIYGIVPEAAPIADGAVSVSLRKVYADPRFWRLAPLSSACIGTAWALQGLWAAQWLTDVDGLDRQRWCSTYLPWRVALSLGAILLGVAADRLRRRVCWTRATFGVCCGCVYCNPACVDPALAAAVILAVGRCWRRSARLPCSVMRLWRNIFRKNWLAGERGAEFMPHRCSVRRAICDRRCSSAVDASSWALSRNRLSDCLCAQPRPSGRGMDLVRVPTSQNRFATEAHARTVLEFKTRKALIQ